MISDQICSHLAFYQKHLMVFNETEKGIVEEEVDGTSAPDIFPHSHNFHVPFFITIIRNDDQPILSQAPSTKKQQPFTLNITYLLMALLALSYLNSCPIKKTSFNNRKEVTLL